MCLLFIHYSDQLYLGNFWKVKCLTQHARKNSLACTIKIHDFQKKFKSDTFENYNSFVPVEVQSHIKLLL